MLGLGAFGTLGVSFAYLLVGDFVCNLLSVPGPSSDGLVGWWLLAAPAVAVGVQAILVVRANPDPARQLRAVHVVKAVV
jgi:hypothetical protein